MKRRKFFAFSPRLNVIVGAIGWLAALSIGAGLMALGVAGHPSFWFGLLALLPLFRAIQVLGPARAGLAGAAWGAMVFGYSTLIPGAPILRGAMPFTLLLLVPCAYGCLGALITRRVRFSPLVLGVGWMLAELALKPVGLRGGLLSGALGNHWLIHSIGSLFGYILVAFVVAYAGALLSFCLFRCNFFGPAFKPMRFGLDDRGVLLWHIIAALTPRCIPCVSRPRAPPNMS